MNNKNINLLVATHTQDTIGRDTTSWSIDTVFRGDFQPVKYNKGQMPYGVTDKTSNVIYVKNPPLTLRYYLPKSDPKKFSVLNRIGLNSMNYIIDSILVYPKHIEIYLEEDV
jgi:hypothetical protein